MEGWPWRPFPGMLRAADGARALSAGDAPRLRWHSRRLRHEPKLENIDFAAGANWLVGPGAAVFGGWVAQGGAAAIRSAPGFHHPVPPAPRRLVSLACSASSAFFGQSRFWFIPLARQRGGQSISTIGKDPVIS
jgi:hypothetical protein